MQIDIRTLDILFRRIAPSQIWEQLCSNALAFVPASAQMLFQQYAVTELTEYSLDEHTMIYRRLQSEAADLAAEMNGRWYCTKDQMAPDMDIPALALHSVLNIAERVLTDTESEPMCKMEHTLLWRDIYWLLGQDLFVCGFLAQRDLEMRRKRPHFTWPAVLRTNNRDLNRLLEKGIAENHQHMKGSSQTFSLSWCSLMNYPESYKELKKWFPQYRQPFVQVSATPCLNSTEDRVQCACLCRMHLFHWLKTKDKPQNEESIQNGDLTTRFTTPWWWLDPIISKVAFAQEQAYFRFTYGARVPLRNHSEACLDYALEPSVLNMAPDAGYRSLAGERSFLYQCFQAFLLGEMDTRTQMTFYLYLVLKGLFRSELIQVNHQVGFRNFYYYQYLKDVLCDRPCYNEELIRMAVNAPITEGNVRSLETRISPLTTPQSLITKIADYDSMKEHADKSVSAIQNSDNFWVEKKKEIDKETEKYFYVYHFIKEPDQKLMGLSALEQSCRHSILRKTVRQQAIAIAKALCASEYFRNRIRGIDSSSHEIGCPPEVFANAFRFLRNFRPSELSARYQNVDPSSYRLSVTYHAGEDFLDIISGLRAIYDAVTLLEMKRFDRIGHALALGIDPEAHYTGKGRQVFLTKQELLDNLVWMLYQAPARNIAIDGLLHQQLTMKAQSLLSQIYGHAIEGNHWSIDLHDYYCSMQLRGDDPGQYHAMRYIPDISFGDYYEEYGISKTNTNIDMYRQSQKLAGLYYYYHYGYREKVAGNEVEAYSITPGYIKLVRDLQNAMQFDLQDRGIVIECNPSSNVLIGTFQNYRNHPIFRFNNIGLEHGGKRRQDCPQLKVCLNTDDLGVFDTSQEFEYALLYHALLEQSDENGNPIYKESDILDYLEHIRQSGFSAVFPPSRQSKSIREEH